uniref:Si:dkey-10o6.2 n=1 Tax=Paramormyrops kingsleyae TaxID=1676925 RepID=A0A3B3RJF2_9TELE
MEIPVLDFEVYRLGENVTDAKLKELSRELRTAFTEIGFVYLRNTGIGQEEVDAVIEISKKFFLLPEEVKIPLSRMSNTDNHGWVAPEIERLNPSRPGDLKEAFNITSLHTDAAWPAEDVVPGFRKAFESFFMRCKDLSLHVLRVMALSLDIDVDIFVNSHKSIGSSTNGSTLRILYYPPVKRAMVKESQLRCGEHSDYGSISLLFQDSKGGLQVKSRSGEFIDAPAIPGTVLINIADLMQRWTSDVFISAKHRVLLPPPGDSSTRQSLVFFAQPDDDIIVICCDGSNKHPPVKTGDYLLERFNETYRMQGHDEESNQALEEAGTRYEGMQQCFESIQVLIRMTWQAGLFHFGKVLIYDPFFSIVTRRENWTVEINKSKSQTRN